IDVSGQTTEQAVQTIETQWLPGLPDAVSLRLVEEENLPARDAEQTAVDPQAPNDQTDSAPGTDPGPEVGPGTAQAEGEDEDGQADAEATEADEPAGAPETVELTPEQLGVRPQLDTAAEAAFQLGREGNLWQQAVAQ